MGKITKNTFVEILKEATTIFETKIIPLPNAVEVKFQSKDEYMTAVKENPLIQQQITMGFYDNIDKEYVGFAVVYAKDKIEIKSLLGLPFTITICDEIAKDVLKAYKANEVKAYITHVYLHEMTHIFDKWIKEKRPDLWEKCLEQTNGNEAMANELFSEEIPLIATSKKDIEIYKEIEKRLWSKIFNRIQKVANKRGISTNGI